MSTKATTATVAAAAAAPAQRRSRAYTRDRRRPADNRTPTRSTWKPRGPRNGLKLVDFLCGAGGASAGLANAGWELVFGANHWQPAIDTHQANFPDVWHECVDVTTINLRKLPRANALWISPICTEASPAGGMSGGWKESEASARGQGSLFDDGGPVAQAGMEKTRATFWEAIRYMEMWRPEIVFVENVPDVVIKWMLFKNWLGCGEDLNYHWQMVNVNSAHIGDLTQGIPYAPQWRDRLYIVFVRKDIGRTYDFSPRPHSYCFGCRETVQGVQTWCPAAQNRWLKAGRYRRDPNTNYGSYWYTCPSGCRDERGDRARVEPFVLPILGSIDWADLGTPIGENRLGANTLRRIAIGQNKLWYPGSELTTLDPFLTILRNNCDAQGLDLPVPSVTTSGNNLSVVFPDEAHGAFTVKHNGGQADPWNLSRSVGEPLGTVCSTGGKQALVLPYYSDDEPHGTVQPLGTVSTRDRHALVTADGADVPLRACNYRLLKPVESARAQVLPVDDGYVITGTEEEQKAQIGNAVTSNASQWLGLGAAEILQAI